MSCALGNNDLRPFLTGEYPEAHHRDGWRRPFGTFHTCATSGLFFALAAWWLLASHNIPDAGSGLLLVGGALIGIPHGSSDFLVAHRLFRPWLGRGWLPAFILAYLALVFIMVGAWLILPTVTLVLFLLLSGLHFGAEDLGAQGAPPSMLRMTARATTPLVPIVMFHMPEVAPFFATMSGRSVGAVIAALLPLKTVLLSGWALVLIVALLNNLASSCVWRPLRGMESLELIALALAAMLLPPLVTFAVYFCLVHAVRHMAELTAREHPNDGARALRLAGTIVVPSALVCLLVLAGSWSAIAGVVKTKTLLCAALQLIAALTAPHMILDFLDSKDLQVSPPRRFRRHQQHGLPAIQNEPIFVTFSDKWRDFFGAMWRVLVAQACGRRWAAKPRTARQGH